jgi:hypothetical protein
MRDLRGRQIEITEPRVDIFSLRKVPTAAVAGAKLNSAAAKRDQQLLCSGWTHPDCPASDHLASGMAPIGCSIVRI